MKKPIKVNNGEFITDSNFEVMHFTYNQALSYGKKYAKVLTDRQVGNGYKFKCKGVKDCGEYWTYTIQ